MTRAATLALGLIIVAALVIAAAYAFAPMRWWGPYIGWPQGATLTSVTRDASNATLAAAKAWAISKVPPGSPVTLNYPIPENSQGNFYWSPEKPTGTLPNSDWQIWYYGRTPPML